MEFKHFMKHKGIPYSLLSDTQEFYAFNEIHGYFVHILPNTKNYYYYYLPGLTHPIV